MQLFVGLGNPGKQYEGTRHNMGFSALRKFADIAGGVFDRTGFNGSYGMIKNAAFPAPILILLPQTFMNLSGTSVRPLMDFYRLSPADIVVVCDDMALAPGTIRLRLDGSSGGQKGLQSIIDQLATNRFRRIRIGIGEPPRPDAVSYVLGKPDEADRNALESSVDRAAKALRDIALGHDFSRLMSAYNAMEKN